MLFQLIFSTLPIFAHNIASVGKISEQLNSPETHVNLGQLQYDSDTVLATAGRHHQAFIPSELVTQQIPAQPANYGNVLATIPRSSIRPFFDYANVQLGELPLISAQYQPYYGVVPYYDEMGYGTAFRPSDLAVPQAQSVASPQLNIEVSKLANVGQKGNF